MDDKQKYKFKIIISNEDNLLIMYCDVIFAQMSCIKKMTEMSFLPSARSKTDMVFRFK